MNIPKRKSRPSEAGTRCRRRADRRAYEAPVSMSVMRGDEFGPLVQVTATDISVSGIGVIMRQMMHEGTVGALHLLMPDGTATVVGVTVMNCQYVGEMNHRIGLRFTELDPRYKKSPHMPENCRILKKSAAHRTFRKSIGGTAL